MLYLIFDGDDTLWENNVLFERAIEEFIDHLDHPRLSRAEVRVVLDEIEFVNTRAHGYGVEVFERSLTDCLLRLRDGDPQRDGEPQRDGDAEVLRRLCQPIRDGAGTVELLPGTVETLKVLGSRHRLALLTKGHPAEQRLKISGSGLAELFEHIEIVPEKEPEVYRYFATARGIDPECAWMIGNSPRSDIWPALDAGLGAVLVPHAQTWSLEQRDLPATAGRFLVVDSLPRLLEHF
ncbi:MAG TPA: HAD family hydrolase [Actinomycetes bacterium]|nr:HAD family hydrolase [Actinomycetes bacterium]